MVQLVKLLGSGKDKLPETDFPTRISEVQHLKNSFLEAARLLRQRSDERDQLENTLRQDITQRMRAERFHLLQIVTSRALTESDNIESVTPKIVQAICELTGWEVGAIWGIDQARGELKLIEVWQVPGISLAEFKAACKRINFAPGVGLAGRVWDSGEPIWIRDVAQDSNFLRVQEAVKEELHAGVCFPIKIGATVLGVVECFSRQIRDVDDECLQTLTNIGIQIGQFIERQRALDAVHKSEARFAGVINSTMDAIITVDSRQHILLFNPAAEEMFGCPRAAAIGDHLDRFIPPRFRMAHRAHIEKFSETGVTNRRMGALGALSALRANGEEFPIEASISQLTVEGETIFTVVLRDISNRKRNEEALNRFNQDLEKLVAERTESLNNSLLAQEKLGEQLRQSQKMEAMGTLAAGVAHDFNNILAIIMGYARDLPDQANNSERHAHYIEVIMAAAERGAGLVKQLLTFSRVPSTKKEAVDINLLIQESASMIDVLLQKIATCTLDLDPTLKTVQGDQNQLQQVLINLCVNARDAIVEGGHLRIRTLRASELELRDRFGAGEGEYARIDVSDTGIGMDDETRRRVFEPFFTTKQGKGGTGLGLSVVYGIVRDHGGFIDVESEKGRGTTFTIYLPLVGERAISVFHLAEARQRGIASGETILVVDDEINLLLLLKRTGEKHGFRVITASNGNEAVEVYAQHRDKVAVVLLDWALPGLGGSTVFCKLKELNPDVKVIGITGYLHPDMRVKMLNEGVCEFLQKPCSPAEIYNRVCALISPTERPPAATEIAIA